MCKNICREMISIILGRALQSSAILAFIKEYRTKL